MKQETKQLMNLVTGSVVPEGEWKEDMKNWETDDNGTPEEQFNSLVEVVWNKDELCWIEK